MITSREIGSRLDAAHRYERLQKIQYPHRGRIRAVLLLIALFVTAAMPVRDALKHEAEQLRAMAEMNKRILALNPDPVITAYAKEHEHE